VRKASGVEALVNLRHLDLFGNDLRQIPESIGRLAKLETLSVGDKFSRRSLRELPPSFKKLTRLRELDLSFNSFPALPPVVAGLTVLKILKLNGNKLLRDLKGIGKLKNLEVLDISYCCLKDLPPELAQLRRLRELRMSCPFWSKYKNVTKELKLLSKLPRLEVLYLINAGLKQLPWEVLIEFPKLKSLNLRYNEIRSIPNDIKKAPKLQQIEYADQKIWKRR